MSTRILRECACCHKMREHHARGWCEICYQRWLRHGKPEAGPIWPVRRTRPTGRIPGPVEDRIAEWKLLRDDGFTPERAAKLIGVSLRTIQRYAERERLRNAERAATAGRAAAA